MPFEAVVNAIREALPDVAAIYLFGSRARGEATADSDYDLAVLPKRPVPSLDRWALQEKLASLLHSNVDLVDLRAASTVMRVQVIDGSILLHDGAPYPRALFEATALSDYARLNEERRGILEDIRRSGKTHG